MPYRMVNISDERVLIHYFNFAFPKPYEGHQKIQGVFYNLKIAPF
jgi:hypothetical protein